MSEEPPTRKNFLTRLFSLEPEGEDTAVLSPEDVGLEDEEPEESIDKPQGLTVDRAADVIRSLPEEVAYGSAVPIVRMTLEAAGISMEELGTSIRARESKLNSIIEQRHERIQKLKDDTDQAVRYKEQEIRALEEDIKKFHQARDNGISQEKEKISQARTGLDEVELVRNFFDLPKRKEASPGEEREESAEQSSEQVAESGKGAASTEHLSREEPDDDAGEDTQVLRRPGPLSENWDTRGRREP